MFATVSSGHLASRSALFVSRLLAPLYNTRLTLLSKDRAPGGSHRIIGGPSSLQSQTHAVDIERLATDGDEIVAWPHSRPPPIAAASSETPRLSHPMSHDPRPVQRWATHTIELGTTSVALPPVGEGAVVSPPTLWERFAPSPAPHPSAVALTARSSKREHLFVVVEERLPVSPDPATKTLIDEHDEDFLGGKYTIPRRRRACIPLAAPKPRRLSDEQAMRALLCLVDDG